MILSHYLVSSEVVYQLLFLWLINFDNIFGCISTNYKKKDSSILCDNQKDASPDEIQYTLRNIPSYKETRIISKFKDYMSRKYHWKLKSSDLQFLWMKLKEFTIVNKKDSKISNNVEDEFENNFRNVTSISIEDIEAYLNKDKTENKLVGVLNIGTGSKLVSKEQNRFFDPDEMNQALQSARKFHYYACNLRNVTFCTEKYLKAEENFNIYQFTPPAIWIKRCPKECSCIQPNEDCLPTSIENRIEYILTIAFDGEKSTWPLMLEEHAGCKCRDRCENRRCIYPFELKILRRGVCKCMCIPGFEKKCSKLSEGYGTFKTSDYQCIVNGTCLTPLCRAGELSEEHLYLKRCPKVLY